MGLSKFDKPSCPVLTTFANVARFRGQFVLWASAEGSLDGSFSPGELFNKGFKWDSVMSKIDELPDKIETATTKADRKKLEREQQRALKQCAFSVRAANILHSVSLKGSPYQQAIQDWITEHTSSGFVNLGSMFERLELVACYDLTTYR